MADFVYLIPGDVNDPNFKIQVPRKAALQSELIKSMIQDDDDDDEPVIPLQDMKRTTLEKVVEFLVKHMDDPMREIIKPLQTTDMKSLVGEWDANFMDMEVDRLLDLTLAANFLDIPTLLDLSLAKIATMVKDRNPDEVKQIFKIEGDISPDEERQIREENPWIFDIPGVTRQSEGL